jgi:hypothetical protein
MLPTPSHCPRIHAHISIGHTPMTHPKNSRGASPGTPVPAGTSALEGLALRHINTQRINSTDFGDQTPALEAVTRWRPQTASSSAPPKAVPPTRRRRTPQGYVTPTELAAQWRVCVDKVLRFIQSGELEAFNIASRTSKRPRYLIPEHAIRDFEKARRAGSAPPAQPQPAARRRRPSQPQAKRYF